MFVIAQLTRAAALVVSAQYGGMKTKVYRLIAPLLVASVWSCFAQSNVYSLNANVGSVFIDSNRSSNLVTIAPDASALRSVEGVWRTEAMWIRGKRAEGPAKGYPLTIFTNSEMIIDDGGNAARFKYSTDATVEPWEIDETISRGGTTVTTKSIYKRQGNQMTIASPMTPGGPRPSSFAPDQAGDVAVESLRLLSPEELSELRKLGEDAQGNAAMDALRKIGARFDMNTNRRVRTVMLSSTKVSDADLKHLASFKELDSVSLAQTSVGNEGMKHLAAVDHLRRLNLSMTAVDDTGLQALIGLSNLEELQLIGTPVTDASVNTLSKLTRLKEVDLTFTRVTPDGKARLAQALPGCKLE